MPPTEGCTEEARLSTLGRNARQIDSLLLSFDPAPAHSCSPMPVLHPFSLSLSLSLSLSAITRLTLICVASAAGFLGLSSAAVSRPTSLTDVAHMPGHFLCWVV